MPLQHLHMKADGTYIKHRDVHNVYGALNQRTTHYGVLERNNYEQRVFVLTRSFYIGSQKFGAYWTGDNVAAQEELIGGINTLISGGLSGQFFGGTDLPGYEGNPSQDLYV